MIVVAGEALVDLVIDADGVVTAAVGGAPFNTARACGRLGADVAFIGVLSVDRFGSMMAAQLERDGVAVDELVRLDLPTTLAAAELDDDGAATYRFYIQGTSAPALAAVPDGLAPDVVFTGGLGLVLEPMAETVETMLATWSPECLVVVDVNCRPLVVPDRVSYISRVERVISQADVVKVSDEDLAYLMPGIEPSRAARALLGRGPSAVLLTAGADGVRVLTADADVHVPVAPVDVVDTIGAGDSFGAGFLSWWQAANCASSDVGSIELLVPAVEAANQVAAIVCGRRGADPPWRSELADDWSP